LARHRLVQEDLAAARRWLKGAAESGTQISTGADF